MRHQHAVVWIDHREAHILAFGIAGVDRQVLRSKSHSPNLHHKANSIGPGNAPLDTEFFDSAPYQTLYKELGITAENVAGAARLLVGR